MAKNVKAEKDTSLMIKVFGGFVEPTEEMMNWLKDYDSDQYKTLSAKLKANKTK